jgi:hypothetical protein
MRTPPVAVADRALVDDIGGARIAGVEKLVQVAQEGGGVLSELLECDDVVAGPQRRITGGMPPAIMFRGVPASPHGPCWTIWV